MKKTELPHFNIGKAYGGNQRWMIDPWMHVGGCAALTTCDLLIYMALYKGREDFFPGNAEKITKRDYVKFAMSVRPYLRPREMGIKDVDTYMSAVRQYFEDIEAYDMMVSSLDGDAHYEEAVRTVKESIDRGMPLAYLMLRHDNKEFDFFEWHWFLINGYEEKADTLMIKVATYGAAHWLDLKRLWNTGCEEKGGIVVFSSDKDYM